MWSEAFQAHLDHERLSTEVLMTSVNQWFGRDIGVLDPLRRYHEESVRSLRMQAAQELGPDWVPWGAISDDAPLDGVWQCVCTEGRQHTLRNVIQGTHRLYREWEVTPSVDTRQGILGAPLPEENYLLAVQGSIIQTYPPPAPEPGLDKAHAWLQGRLITNLGYSHLKALRALFGNRSLIGRSLIGGGFRREVRAQVTDVRGRTIYADDGSAWECDPNSPMGGLVEVSRSGEGLNERVILEGTCAWLIEQ